MIFNLKSGHKLKIELQKIPKNRRFKGGYRYKSSSHLFHNDQWYSCNPETRNEQLSILGLIKHKSDSDTRIEEHLPDFKIQEPLKGFKKHLMRFLLQKHPMNRMMLKFRNGFKERKKTVFVFTLAIALSIIYYLINASTNNAVMNWFANNLFAQTIMMFLTISGFINIFTPFSIQKEITRQEIAQKAVKTYEEQKQKDEDDEKARQRATLG